MVILIDMKDKAIEILTKLQKENPYIQSIYLWGSITTDEYIEGKSDIDAIAFVDESTDISEKERLNHILNKELSNLKINFLYPSELNGDQSKGNLTKFIRPEVILYDFPAWIHVSGQEFNKEDFISGRSSIDEIINISLDEIKKRFLPIPEEKDYIYFVKALAKLLYFINQKRLLFKPFRYGDLINDTNESDLKIAQIISETRKSNWDVNLIKNKISELISFL